MGAKELYFKGQYKAAAEQKSILTSVVYKLGALTFLGRHAEARLIFENFQSQLSPDDLILARFHMGLSYTRTSDYRKAREYFAANERALKGKKTKPLARFYIHQGQAFYDFFFSQHRMSQNHAAKGYEILLQMTEPPALLVCLSLDIQGHNLIHLGDIHKGVKNFKQALSVAKFNSLSDLHSDIQLSLELYQAEYTDQIEVQIKRLEKIYLKVENDNDYSRSQLMLQIVKLQLLGGRYKDAHSFLSRNFSVIYKNENKRKVAHLNTLLARLLFIKGQFVEALALTKVAKSHLTEEIDKTLLLPILGLEAKVLKAMAQDTAPMDRQLAEVSQSIDSFLRHRIQARQQKTPTQWALGEDSIGDLIDEIAFRPTATTLQKIVDKNLLGLIPEYFGRPPHEPSLVITELKDTVITIDPDEVTVLQENLSKNLLKILNLLSEGPQTKQTLIEKVWGYQYEALRHDSLIYTSMVRLRKILGSRAHWIQTDDEAYFLSRGVHLVNRRLRSELEPVRRSPQVEALSKDLNFRQLESLAGIKKFTSVEEYSKLWGVTKMTSLRDLRGLCDLGYIEKVGRGRATKYYRTQS
jgi:hypothetical protein